MDYKVIWSSEALGDIQAIGEYIARDSEYYSYSLVQNLYESIQRLTTFPKIGRIVPELGKESVREIFVGQYRIIYEISGLDIHILTVIHGKRLLENQTKPILH